MSNLALEYNEQKVRKCYALFSHVNPTKLIFNAEGRNINEYYYNANISIEIMEMFLMVITITITTSLQLQQYHDKSAMGDGH